MEKGISLGVVTALKIEREGFLEALQLHNDVLNQKTEIKQLVEPSIGNTIYQTQLFYQNPNNKNGLLFFFSFFISLSQKETLI